MPYPKAIFDPEILPKAWFDREQPARSVFDEDLGYIPPTGPVTFNAAWSGASRIAGTVISLITGILWIVKR